MTVLIIGGAGFIGCNVAEFLANRGDKIVIFDNLSRRGSSRSLLCYGIIASQKH